MRLAHGCQVVGASFLGPQAVRAIFEPYQKVLAQGGIQEGPFPGALGFFVATGGTEALLLEAIAQRRKDHPREPVVLVAHPDNNSLPACLETLARLRLDGIPGRIVFFRGPKDGDALAALRRFLDLSAVANGLASTRLGALGEASSWLVASSQGAQALQETWGVSLVPLRLDALVEGIKALEGQGPDEAAAQTFAKAKAQVEPGAKDLAAAYRVYRALKDLTQAHRLDALTLRCFDLVGGLGTTGCYALSRLADEGLSSGCEGDIPSILALRWLALLTGKTAWMANPARIDIERHEILLAHCTVPLSLVEEYRLRSHFESGQGLGLQGFMRRAPVTLVRIGGRRLERLWTAQASIVEAGDEEGLCRTQVRVLLEGGNPEELLRDPLGNHLVLVKGHVEDLILESHSLIVPLA